MQVFQKKTYQNIFRIVHCKAILEFTEFGFDQQMNTYASESGRICWCNWHPWRLLINTKLSSKPANNLESWWKSPRFARLTFWTLLLAQLVYPSSVHPDFRVEIFRKSIFRRLAILRTIPGIISVHIFCHVILLKLFPHFVIFISRICHFYCHSVNSIPGFVMSFSNDDLLSYL